MVAINPRLTLLALLPLLGLPVAMISLGQRIHRRSQAIQEQFSELTSHAHENLSGVRVVRAYRQEARGDRRLPPAERRVPRDGTSAWPGCRGSSSPCSRCWAGSAPWSCCTSGGRLVMAGTVTVGEFVAFGVYLAMLVWPMIALGWAVNLVQRGAASMGRINQLFREQPAITEPDAPADAAARAGRARGRVPRTCGSAIPARASGAGCCRTISFTVEAGPLARHRRRHRLGQVHAGGSAGPGLRPRPRRRAHRRRRHPAAAARRAPPRGRASCRRRRSSSARRCARTSCSARPDDGRLERVAEVAQLTEALPALPNGYDTHAGRARHQSLRRAEAAQRRSRGRWRRTRRCSCSTTR